jgi:hypothetical protein
MANVNSPIDRKLASFLCGETDPAAFPHPEHLRLGYEMLARHPFAETALHFSRGLKKLAAKSGRPQLYHDTITVAFLALLAERRAQTQCQDWESFIRENRDLLDKRCLERWYDPARLQSDIARKNFILPRSADGTLTESHPSLETAPAPDGGPPLGKMARVIQTYAIVYASLIIWASAITVWTAHGHDAFLVGLGSTEIIGAFLFLFSQTRAAGIVLLLIVFAIATFVDFASGGLPIRFVIYAASAVLVWLVSNGLKSATRDSIRPARAVGLSN